MIKAICLDTHVVVWLFLGLIDKLSPTAQKLITSNDLYISPIAILEIQYLNEIGRINVSANEIIVDLQSKVGLLVDDLSFEILVRKALDITWTRDPFDRLIVATAMAHGYHLITKDENILLNFSSAIWN